MRTHVRVCGGLESVAGPSYHFISAAATIAFYKEEGAAVSLQRTPSLPFPSSSSVLTDNKSQNKRVRRTHTHLLEARELPGHDDADHHQVSLCDHRRDALGVRNVSCRLGFGFVCGEACVFVYMCVCVCVRERESERGR
jgi:hypothetical protein